MTLLSAHMKYCSKVLIELFFSVYPWKTCILLANLEAFRCHGFIFFQNGLMRFTTAALDVMSKEKGGKGGVIVNTASSLCEFSLSIYQIAVIVVNYGISKTIVLGVP